VLLSDRSEKSIEDLRVGDKVLGVSGINIVRDFAYELMEPDSRQKLISINCGDYFITNNHPLMTEDGWKAYTGGCDFSESFDHDSLKGKVGKLEIGDIIIGYNGNKTTVETIKILDSDKYFKLFVPVLSGDHTFYANDFLVIGFEPDNEGHYKIEDEREHDGQPPYDY